MRLAIAGKGGTGKTTVAGTLARALAQAGRSVVGIDADSNPNLDVILGFRDAAAAVPEPLPRDLLQKVERADGTHESVLVRAPEEVIEEYGRVGPDGVRLVVMGKVGHAGKG